MINKRRLFIVVHGRTCSEASNALLLHILNSPRLKAVNWSE